MNREDQEENKFKDSKIQFPKIHNSNQKNPQKINRSKSNDVNIGKQNSNSLKSIVSQIKMDISEKSVQKEEESNISLQTDKETSQQQKNKNILEKIYQEKGNWFWVSSGQKISNFSEFTFEKKGKGNESQNESENFTFDEFVINWEDTSKKQPIKAKAQNNYNFSQEILKNEILNTNKQRYQSQKQLEKELEQQKILKEINSIKRVALTGSTGYLGREVLSQLLQQGYQVNAGIRANTTKEKKEFLERLQKNHPEQLQIMTVDFLDKESLKTLLQNSECVIHCAAYQYKDDFESEVDGIVNEIEGFLIMLNYCKEFNILRLILPGCLSNAINGKYWPLYTESHWSNPDYCDWSEQSKFLMEKCAWNFQSEHNNFFKLTVFLSGLLLGDLNELDLDGNTYQILKKIKDFNSKDCFRIQVPLVCRSDLAQLIVRSIMQQNTFNQRYFVCEGTYWIDQIQKDILQNPTNEISAQQYESSNFNYNNSFIKRMILKVVSYFDWDLQKLIMMNNREFKINTQKIIYDFGYVYQTYKNYISVTKKAFQKLENKQLN